MAPIKPEDLAEFLYESFRDIRDTIRAIDTKLTAVLIILILPLSAIGKITFYVMHGIKSDNAFISIGTLIVLAIFFFAWGISISITILGLSSIEDPSLYLSDSKCPNGTLYNGGLYKFKFYDVFKPPAERKSLALMSKQIERLPKEENDVINELLFEQHKLVFIRDLKTFRQKKAFLFLSIFMGAGILLWVISNCLEELICH